MTLTTAVTNILCKRVTEDQAKDFALNQFGVLAAYLRNQQVKDLLEAKGITERLKRKEEVTAKAKKLVTKIRVIGTSEKQYR